MRSMLISYANIQKKMHPAGFYPLISQSRMRPCSLPTANCSELGEMATDEIRPKGVLDVGQLRYTVQDGR
jgi:hypothetical protein